MSDDWRGRLYPERQPKRRWLELYAQRFDTVEVNSTFYRLARRSGVEGWVAQTPPGFLFAVKASRYLTHVRRLRDISEGIKRFYEPLEPLVAAGRLGPVLWQLPENFHRDDERLHGWLELLPAGRHTIEFRHQSWFSDDVLKLLRSRGIALAIGDHPSRPFQSTAATAAWRFIRFHYGACGRRGNYSQREIAEWAKRVAGWRRSREVYAYFNNDWNSYAPANALSLLKLLGEAPYETVTRSAGTPKRSVTSAGSTSSR
jgi:uncharacterized protein YecE (DUF72 family)